MPFRVTWLITESLLSRTSTCRCRRSSCALSAIPAAPFASIAGLCRRPRLTGRRRSAGRACRALAIITRLLITSARRRRRDLAVLRTIGFTRRQVHATVAWQAVTLTVVALVIGIAVSALPGEVAARSTTAEILRSE
jgi:hypothetical protein